MNCSLIGAVFLLLVKYCSCLKILAVFPHEGKSHLYVFIPIVRELSARGHDITVITRHTTGVKAKNYHEILMTGKFEGIGDYTVDMFDMSEVSLSFGSAVVLTSMGVEGCISMFTNPEVQELMASDQKFDLIIAELFNSECFLSFVDKFEAPVVGLSSSPIMAWHTDRFGQPDNPAYIRNIELYSSREGFLLRTENFLLTLWYKGIHWFQVRLQQYYAQKYVPGGMRSYDDLIRSVSLLLVNSHFTCGQPMPFVPGVVEVGGVHIDSPKKLPENIEKFINESTHGVIYFSLGF